jgi:hypothetical protein
METGAVMAVMGAVSGKGGAAVRQSGVCAAALPPRKLSAIRRKRNKR